MATLNCKIGGMSCMGCVNSVKRLLEQVPGVIDSRIDLASASAEIDYDPDRVDPAVIKAAITEGGYPVDN